MKKSYIKILLFIVKFNVFVHIIIDYIFWGVEMK